MEKKSIKNGSIEALKIVGAAIVGGALGASVGKPSLAIGLATLAGGVFMSTKGNEYANLVTVAGAGMIIAPNYTPSSVKAVEAKGVNPAEGLGMVEVSSENGKSFFKNILGKTYLEKISPKLAESVGLGELTEDVTYMAPVNNGGDAEAVIRRIAEQQMLDGGDAFTSEAELVALSGLGKSDAELMFG